MPFLKDCAPQGATHFHIAFAHRVRGGFSELAVNWYKQTEQDWWIWHTDSDNEYPQWWPLGELQIAVEKLENLS